MQKTIPTDREYVEQHPDISVKAGDRIEGFGVVVYLDPDCPDCLTVCVKDDEKGEYGWISDPNACAVTTTLKEVALQLRVNWFGLGEDPSVAEVLAGPKEALADGADLRREVGALLGLGEKEQTHILLQKLQDLVHKQTIAPGALPVEVVDMQNKPVAILAATTNVPLKGDVLRIQNADGAHAMHMTLSRMVIWRNGQPVKWVIVSQNMQRSSIIKPPGLVH